jgi:hypothetical protein
MQGHNTHELNDAELDTVSGGFPNGTGGTGGAGGILDAILLFRRGFANSGLAARIDWIVVLLDPTGSRPHFPR